MTIESEFDLEGLKKAGRVVALTLQEMLKHVEPGITTAELDAIGAEMLARYGARSAPQVMYDFPGATCICLNTEAAHGIPGDRPIQPGDLVNVDVSAELDGFYGDTAATVLVPPIPAIKQRLVDAARHARGRAIAAARAGRPLNVIGRTVEESARRDGFEVIHDLPGHGVGHLLHEEPTVLNFATRDPGPRLTPGLVITVEPFLTTGARHVAEGPDGWTLSTVDGSLSAQFEHTIVVTRGKPIILTAMSN